jgi:hypothetical protein
MVQFGYNNPVFISVPVFINCMLLRGKHDAVEHKGRSLNRIELPLFHNMRFLLSATA